MRKIAIKTEYITLSQFLKLSNIVQSGGEAKVFLQNSKILVNGEEDNRKGRKLYRSDKVLVENEEYEIC